MGPTVQPSRYRLAGTGGSNVVPSLGSISAGRLHPSPYRGKPRSGHGAGRSSIAATQPPPLFCPVTSWTDEPSEGTCSGPGTERLVGAVGVEREVAKHLAVLAQDPDIEVADAHEGCGPLGIRAPRSSGLVGARGDHLRTRSLTRREGGAASGDRSAAMSVPSGWPAGFRVGRRPRGRGRLRSDRASPAWRPSP